MTSPLLIASDHAGFALKEHLKAALERLGVAYEDLGTHSDAPCDYPDFAHRVAGAISSGRAQRGVLVCGTGQGMIMAANRHRGVRAALPHDEETARLSRAHNDSNVLALGGRVFSPEQVEAILKVWLETPAIGGRHAMRVAKIDSGA
jgi:RpiB/LacA/LacB family sugar-phosphate isomerase